MSVKYTVREVVGVRIRHEADTGREDHLISSPLALASGGYMPKAWVKYDELPALQTSNISHIHGTVSSVDCERKIAIISDTNTGKNYEESYDYLIAASGLKREWPTVPQSLKRVEYLKEAGDHIEKLRTAKEGVVVIGGGKFCSSIAGSERSRRIDSVEQVPSVSKWRLSSKSLSQLKK